MLTRDIINTEYFVMPCNISGDLRKPAQRQTGSRMFGLARVAGRATGLHLRAKNRSLDVAKRNRGITVGSQTGHASMQRSAIEELRSGARMAIQQRVLLG